MNRRKGTRSNLKYFIRRNLSISHRPRFANDETLTFSDYKRFEETLSNLQGSKSTPIVDFGAIINRERIPCSKNRARDLNEVYKGLGEYIAPSISTYKILTAYGMTPDGAYRLCRKPYEGYWRLNSDSHTPYYEMTWHIATGLTILYPEIDEKYPNPKFGGEACREYNILHDIEDHYRLITGDNWKYDEKDPDRSEKQMDYYGRILKFAFQNENQIVRKLTGKMETKEVIEYAEGDIQINLNGEPLITQIPEENKKKKHAPRNKPTPKYIQSCIKNINNGKFPEYMPVRECAALFAGEEKASFLHEVIRLAKAHEEKAITRFNIERVIRVAYNILTEDRNKAQLELF